MAYRKRDANHLDDEHCHTGFDNYEYGMLKFGTPAWAQTSLNRSHGSFNFQEHPENPEHDQARHQGIHNQGQDETCYAHGDRPLFKICGAVCR